MDDLYTNKPQENSSIYSLIRPCITMKCLNILVKTPLSTKRGFREKDDVYLHDQIQLSLLQESPLVISRSIFHVYKDILYKLHWRKCMSSFLSMSYLMINCEDTVLKFLIIQFSKSRRPSRRTTTGPDHNLTYRFHNRLRYVIHPVSNIGPWIRLRP